MARSESLRRSWPGLNSPRIAAGPPKRLRGERRLGLLRSHAARERGYRQRQRDRNCRTGSFLTRVLQRAMMGPGDADANGQAEAAAAVRPRPRTVRTVESLAYIRQVVRRDSTARIVDPDGNT